MKKIMMAAILAMVMLSATACNNDKNTASTTENITAQTAAVTTEAATESDTAAIESTEAADAEETIGAMLLADFQERTLDDPSQSAQIIAEGLLTNAAIQFNCATITVEPGLLTGLGNTEITGFSEGTMFAPVIGTIPFVGYVFTLEESTDAEAFQQTLKDNADLRWNVCTEAEEMIIEQVDNKVFFLMCPRHIDETAE